MTTIVAFAIVVREKRPGVILGKEFLIFSDET